MGGRIHWTLLLVFLVPTASLFSVRAEEPFYQNKQLTILISHGPGGPTDISGRLLARHLSKHIPGSPRIVVKNIAGAGGMVATNYLGQRAKPDGLTMAFFTALGDKVFMEPLQDRGLRVDPKKFGVVATVTGISIGYMRTDVPPGMKKPEDLVKANKFKVAGVRRYSGLDLRERLVMDMLGVNYQYVTGYGGSTRARAAVAGGEAHYYTESLPSYRAVVQPTMVEPGIVIPMMYYGLDDGKTIKATPELLQGIPIDPFNQLFQKLKGKQPSGIMWQTFRAVNRANANLLRMVVVPEGTPKEALETLRTAVRKAVQDPAYRMDALKTVKFVPRFVFGEEAADLMNASVTMKPEVLTFLKDYISKVERN